MGEGAGEAPSPVNHLDQDGRTFTERLAKDVNTLRKEINDKIKAYNERIQKLSIKKRIPNRRINRIQTKITELNNALIEFDELEASTQLYDIQYNAKMTYNSDPHTQYLGWVEFDKDNNTFMIKTSYYKEYEQYFLIHELKHAYQFEVGQLSFNRNGNGIGYFYDYTDEEAAFTREHALGSNEYRPNESYNSLYDKRRNKRSINESYDGNDIVHPKFIRL